MWEPPKIRGALFGGPYNKDPTIQGTTLKGPGISLGGSGMSYGESLGLFGVSETLDLKVPQFP